MAKNSKIFRKKVEQFIEEKSLMNPSDMILVALSGGSDSVCLLHVLKSLGYRLAALHCNFRLRGVESERDERFVRELCQSLGVPLTVKDFNTSEYATRKKISIEMAARELRYAFFEEERIRQGADAIAVAHHIDDNTETFILNAIRGTGIRGLAAIQPRNGRIVRPLLCVTHTEILEELRECSMEYVTDSTNLEDRYSRNKVRLNIMPMMKEINPSAPTNIMTTIENMQEMLKIYEGYTQAAISRCVSRKNGNLVIDISELKESTSPISVLHEVMSPLGFNRNQQLSILQSEESGRTFQSIQNEDREIAYTALIDRGTIIIRKAGNGSTPPVALSEYTDIATEEATPPIDFNPSPLYAYIDADKIKGELHVRSVKSGDRFQPFGMKGKKLVSDYLTDRRMSLFDKERQLVVCDSQSIVWLVGQRSSEQHRVDTTTRRVIILKWQKNED